MCLTSFNHAKMQHVLNNLETTQNGVSLSQTAVWLLTVQTPVVENNVHILVWRNAALFLNLNNVSPKKIKWNKIAREIITTMSLKTFLLPPKHYHHRNYCQQNLFWDPNGCEALCDRFLLCPQGDYYVVCEGKGYNTTTDYYYNNSNFKRARHL